MNVFFKKLKNLPHLYALAGEMNGYIYDNQKKLAEEYRKMGRAFIYSEPYRSIAFCQHCDDYATTVVCHTLEIPAQDNWRFDFYEIDLHRWQEHSETPPDALVKKVTEL